MLISTDLVSIRVEFVFQEKFLIFWLYDWYQSFEEQASKWGTQTRWRFYLNIKWSLGSDTLWRMTLIFVNEESLCCVQNHQIYSPSSFPPTFPCFGRDIPFAPHLLINNGKQHIHILPSRDRWSLTEDHKSHMQSDINIPRPKDKESEFQYQYPKRRVTGKHILVNISLFLFLSIAAFPAR